MDMTDADVGSVGRIKGYHIDCDRFYRSQLLSMGLLPNAQFEVLRRAPLGDPLLIRVNNDLITLRRQEASVLQVEWLPNADR